MSLITLNNILIVIAITKKSGFVQVPVVYFYLWSIHGQGKRFVSFWKLNLVKKIRVDGFGFDVVRCYNFVCFLRAKSLSFTDWSLTSTSAGMA